MGRYSVRLYGCSDFSGTLGRTTSRGVKNFEILFRAHDAQGAWPPRSRTACTVRRRCFPFSLVNVNQRSELKRNNFQLKGAVSPSFNVPLNDEKTFVSMEIA